MSEQVYKFSVFVIFDEDKNYIKTLSTKELKDKELKENEEAKYFMELKVNG